MAWQPSTTAPCHPPRPAPAGPSDAPAITAAAGSAAGASLTVQLPTGMSSDLTGINYLVQAYDAATSSAVGTEVNLQASGIGGSRTIFVSWEEPAKLAFAVTVRFGESSFNARSPASARTADPVTVGAAAGLCLVVLVAVLGGAPTAARPWQVHALACPHC